MNSSKIFDAVSIITLLVLIPMVAVSGFAYWSGRIDFADYVDMWREPVTLLFGFWLRGASKESLS